MESEWFTEKINYYRGIRYAIVLNTRLGYRCGYVEIPENSPLYEKDLIESANLINSVEVTFSGKLKHINGTWFIGWDHYHIYDGIDKDAIKKHYQNLPKDELYKIITNAIEMSGGSDGKIYYLNDVENECFETIDELLQKELISL